MIIDRKDSILNNKLLSALIHCKSQIFSDLKNNDGTVPKVKLIVTLNSLSLQDFKKAFLIRSGRYHEKFQKILQQTVFKVMH